MQLDYEFPTRVILEQDALAEHANLVTELGSSCMVVMDSDLDDAHPAKQELLFCLEYNGISRTIYYHTRRVAAGIPNLEAGAALAREADIDFIVAIGRDATLEAGKAIALLAAQEINNATLLVNSVPQHIPVVCIPLAPGSGTEVTPEIHVAQSGLDRLTMVRNRLCSPHLALLDPRYSLSMDKRTIQCNYMKILGRAIEAISSEKANPISDAIAIAALGTISDMFDIMLNEKHEFTAWDYEHLMLAANQAGLAIALSGTNTLEALASPLTYVSNIRLGEAYGLMIPPFVAYLQDRTRVVGKMVLQSLNLPNLESLEEFLWDLIGEITPISETDIEQCANAAISNPSIKAGVLSLDLSDIMGAYNHLLADESDEETSSENE